MALQGSGAISADNIRSEFGQTGQVSMASYYRGGGTVPDGPPANSSVPTSGQIAFSNFYGASNAPYATGGTLTTSGGYRIHTFNASDSFIVVNQGPVGNNFEVILVGAGGAGGDGYAVNNNTIGSGGGGAGNVSAFSTSLNVGTLSVVISSGGARAYQGQGSDGGGLTWLGGVIRSVGSGGGGGYFSAGRNAPVDFSRFGSGGGASGNSSTTTLAGGTGVYSGGTSNGVQWGPGAGGGGAGTVGANATTGGGCITVYKGGNGGNGVSTWAGTFGGGGGGGERWNGSCSDTFGAGGSGGGGRSAYTHVTNGNFPAVAGTANTGGGGGGGTGGNNNIGANGGSGVVIIRYQYP